MKEKLLTDRRKWAKKFIESLVNNNWTHKKIAETLGVTETTISRWRNEKATPKSEEVTKLMELEFKDPPKSTFMQLAEDAMSGKHPAGLDPKSVSQIQMELVKIPVLGSIPCGKPEDAVEEKIGEMYVSPWWLGGSYKDCYALLAKGDSMEPKISEGDMVVVKQGVDPHPGDCVVAKFDGEYTLKVLGENGKLQSLNVKYKEMNPKHECQVVGVVVFYQKKWRR